MKLSQAIETVINADDSSVVFAEKPWQFDSNAIIDNLDENYRVPQHIHDAGFEYFLESELIHELAEIKTEKNFSLEKLIELIIYYAEYDAYPDWVNELS